MCSILPPLILRALATRGDAEDRARAAVALEMSAAPRVERQAVAMLAATGELVAPPRRKRRVVFDARTEHELPGLNVRSEGAPRGRDEAVNEAYEGAGKVYDFFRRVYGRSSIDDRGMRIDSTVHFGDDFNNAHWNGRQMIYGDGDGKYFHRFTAALDVIGHELTHGIAQYTANFGASGQCGALAEHFCDVFGVLVKQYWRGESAEQSDWLVGADLFTRRVRGKAVRSLKAPGTAFDDPILGRDPQPAHMRAYVKTSADDRGVHINSGIPNHAFYRVATLLGGPAWEVAGRIWYRALTNELMSRSRFQHCADATWRAAGELYGPGSAPQEAVQAGWRAVGIEIAPRLRIRRAPDAFEAPEAAAEVPVFV